MLIESVTGEQIEVATLRWKFEGGEYSEICDENPWAVSTEEELLLDALENEMIDPERR